MKILVAVSLLISLAASAAPPPLNETGKKTAQSDPSVVKDEVDRMKEEVIDKKAQMLLFKQLIKSEGIESTYPIVVLTHTNEMSNRYKIYSMVYSIDGERVYSYYAEDNLGKQPLARDTQVFKGPIVAGTHELTVDIVYKGNDAGVFSYINEYKIPTQLKRSFKVDKGQNLDVQVVGYEKGWALTDFKDRPDLKIKFNSSLQAKAVK